MKPMGQVVATGSRTSKCPELKAQLACSGVIPSHGDSQDKGGNMLWLADLR